MVLRFTAVVVEASVVEDCAVVVGAAFVAVVVGQDVSVVVGVTAVFVASSFVVVEDGGVVVGAAFAVKSVVIEDSVPVAIEDDIVFETVAVVGYSVEASFVIEDATDVESVVVGGVVVKVTAVHF